MTIALTDRLGIDVVDNAGLRLGRLRDLVIRGSDDAPAVTRIVVCQRGGIRQVAEWTDVELHSSHVVLRGDASLLRPLALRDDEIELFKDVVDTQIVDDDDRRVVRVADVELERSGEALRVVAVDVGTAALLRRLGLRRIAVRGSRDVIAWCDLRAAHSGQPLHTRGGRAVIHRPATRRYPHRILRRRRA